MTEADIEIILERAKERHPGLKPRIISDNGPQFLANSAIGYITPKDMLAGHHQEIQAERDRKLKAAREQWKNFAASGLREGKSVAQRARERFLQQTLCGALVVPALAHGCFRLRVADTDRNRYHLT
jgi:hypothetical protein